MSHTQYDTFKQKTLKLYYCHAYLKKESWSQFNFCHYPFSHPRYVDSADNEINNVNSFIPGVNKDHVHVSKTSNSIRTVGDQEMKAVSTQVFPQLSLQTIKCRRCDQCRVFFLHPQLHQSFTQCILPSHRSCSAVPQGRFKSWLPACLSLSSSSHLSQQTNLTWP